MRLLMHVCCGPCALYPLGWLRARGHEVHGYFYNPNIHPYREFRKRIEALESAAAQTAFPVEIVAEYELASYLRRVVFHEAQRCAICVELRLEATVLHAKKLGFEGFTTSLLYSKYQNHAQIKRRAEELARQHEIPFIYEDFRLGWQQGIEESLALNLYRQPYCGCIYSEQERYDKRLRRQKGASASVIKPESQNNLIQETIAVKES